jgi:phage-related protein (TIGR01555 family)
MAKLKWNILNTVIAKMKLAPPQQVARHLVAPELPDGVIPNAAVRASIAMDSAAGGETFLAMDDAVNWMQSYAPSCELWFKGYPYLAQLTQRSEYRSPAETMASEMTRRWIKLNSAGKGDKSEKISKINAEMKRLTVREHFRKMAELDHEFGRGQLFARIKGQNEGTPLRLDAANAPKGSLLGFTPIEPMWTTPYFYNSTNPLEPDFYKPKSWFVFGKRVHASRMLTFIARPVPDMLKPSYNFGGVSMSQLMEPYVNQWLRTRNSVSDMLHSFSISGVKTDMQATMGGDDGDELIKRAELFNATRDNRGLMLLDKDSEEFFQFNVPLSGLDALQAQAQEHMAAPTHIPLVKLLGVTPTGLNNSSDGEITVFYDYVRAQQELLFRPHLTIVLDLIQLSLFGEIDPDIDFEFVPLAEPSAPDLGKLRKDDADAGVAFINAGVISPEEERERLANDPSSGYSNIEPSDVPERPDQGELDGDPQGNPAGTGSK